MGRRRISVRSMMPMLRRVKHILGRATQVGGKASQAGLDLLLPIVVAKRRQPGCGFFPRKRHRLSAHQRNEPDEQQSAGGCDGDRLLETVDLFPVDEHEVEAVRKCLQGRGDRIILVDRLVEI